MIEVDIELLKDLLADLDMFEPLDGDNDICLDSDLLRAIVCKAMEAFEQN